MSLSTSTQTMRTLLGRRPTPASSPHVPAGDPFRRLKEGARDAADPSRSPPWRSSSRCAAFSPPSPRLFRNAEDRAIEAILTWPVPVDAVVHGLKVRIEGRELAGVAMVKTAARRL